MRRLQGSKSLSLFTISLSLLEKDRHVLIENPSHDLCNIVENIQKQMMI